MNTKQCTKCKAIKDVSSFTKKAASIDGLQSHCSECIRLYNRSYKTINKEQIKPKVKEYYISHKDAISKYYKEYINQPAHHAKEIIRCSTKQRKRRAFKRSVNESYTKEDEQYTLDLFNRSCVNCGATERLSIDHHYPLSKGHALTRSNAVVLCLSCNSSKCSKMPEDFYSHGILLEINAKLNQR